MFSMPESETFLRNKDSYDHQAHFYTEAMKYCKQKRVAIDVGAHIGLFSSKMVKDFHEVHAFEPMFHKYLKENVSSKNLIIHKVGVSNKNTQRRFSIREHHTGMSKIDNKGKHIINCIDLDSLSFQDVDLIKIDVENHEYFALQGMQKFFTENSPVVIIELNDKSTRLSNMQFIKSFGYTEVFRQQTDFIFVK